MMVAQILACHLLVAAELRLVEFVAESGLEFELVGFLALVVHPD